MPDKLALSFVVMNNGWTGMCQAIGVKGDAAVEKCEERVAGDKGGKDCAVEISSSQYLGRSGLKGKTVMS